MEAREPLIIPGLKPQYFRIFSILIRFPLNKLIISLEIELSHIKIIVIGSNVQQCTIFTIDQLLNIINDTLTERLSHFIY